MNESPIEYIRPTISNVEVEEASLGTRAVTFGMRSAGERYYVMLWNPQLVVPGVSEPEQLSKERLEDCFDDCDICQVFVPNTKLARMEFQKVDEHPMVKASRIQTTRLAANDVYEDCPSCRKAMPGRWQGERFNLALTHFCSEQPGPVASWKRGPGHPPGSFELQPSHV